MEHECIEKFTTRKIDYCTGESYNKCYGIEDMTLEIWFMDKDGQEFYCDSWTITKVNFCPFCGLKSQPERSKREDLDCCKKLDGLNNVLCNVHWEWCAFIPDDMMLPCKNDDCTFLRLLIEEFKMRCSEHGG